MELTFGDISRYILIVTAIVATITYPKYKQTPLKYLLFYIWYAVLLEIVARWLVLEGYYNAWWYNVGINIEILFYLFLYYQYVSGNKLRRLILIGGALYEGYFLVNYLFLSDSWNEYQFFPFSTGGVLLIVVVFLFLLEMFQSDKVLYTEKYLIFWISLGLLFYNIIPLPLFVARAFISGYSLMGIQFLGNILMYFSFIYGFIWSSMKYKS
jgi:hypothetical protein